MGGTFSKKRTEHQQRRDFVLTLVVGHKRLKNKKRHHDDGRNGMREDTSWEKFGSQVVLDCLCVPACLSWTGRAVLDRTLSSACDWTGQETWGAGAANGLTTGPLAGHDTGR